MSGSIPTLTSPPWSVTTKRLVALVVFGVLLVVAQQVAQSAWTVLIVAVVLAYLLSPVVNFFERRLAFVPGHDFRRSLAVLLAWLLVVGLVGLVLGLVLPATLVQLRQFAEDLPGLLADTQADLKRWLSRPIRVGDTEFVPWNELEDTFNPDSENGGDLVSTVQDALLSLANPALDVLGGAVSLLFNLLLLLMLLFYLMRDGPDFVAYLVSRVPDSYRGDVLRLLHELGLVWNAYLRGQVTLSLIIGVVIYVNALILGLPQPLMLGLVAAFLEFIPNLGPALSQIPALLFALTTPSATLPTLDAGLFYAVVVSLSYMIIQQLEAMFLVPRVMGRSLDLHPFVVLVAILIGASLAGVLGVILAAPSVATLRLLLRYLRSKLLDEEVFPALPVQISQQRGLLYRLMHYFLLRRFPVFVPEQRSIPWPGMQPGEAEDEPPAQARWSR